MHRGVTAACGRRALGPPSLGWGAACVIVSQFRCAATASASPTSETLPQLAVRVDQLAATVGKQQVALQGVARKVLASGGAPASPAPSVAVPKAEQQPTTTRTTTVSDASTTARIDDVRAAVSALTRRVAALEFELAASKKSSTSSVGGASARGGGGGAVTADQMAAIINRLCALESRQAIVRVAQKARTGAASNGGADERDALTAKHCDSPDGTAPQLLVAMEPDADGTPRLTTAQVLVFHPTATAAQVRTLMESAGPVVSCLRRPGEKRDAAGGGKSPQPSSASAPCFVVGFQSTVDAVRAIENVSGMSIGPHRVTVEPYAMPELSLAVAPLPSAAGVVADAAGDDMGRAVLDENDDSAWQ